jgi:hypothetical protein
MISQDAREIVEEAESPRLEYVSLVVVANVALRTIGYPLEDLGRVRMIPQGVLNLG